jgi:ribonuclease PH
MAAVSVGIVGGVEMLDLCYEEDAAADTDMNVVMIGGGGIVEIQATAEAAPFDRRQTDRLLDLAQVGTISLHDVQAKALAGR